MTKINTKKGIIAGQIDSTQHKMEVIDGNPIFEDENL